LQEASIEFDVVRRLPPGVHAYECGLFATGIRHESSPVPLRNIARICRPFDKVNRCVCYCRDCQARALWAMGEILDGNGGTDVIQPAP
jgi:hypothetical protein